MLSWIHPHLSQSVDSGKGRQLQASQRIQKGEVLLIDPPYAIIPISSVDHNSLLCSNPECNTSVPLDTGSRCSNRCNADVIWCSDSCRSADKPRHVFECTWLAKYTNSLQSKWGEYNFGMLWLMVRILSIRHITNPQPNDINNTQNTPQSTFKSGWPAIDALCGTPETWSHSQVREWTVLVKKYLSSSALPHSMSNDAVLALICKEEANSFGLYPRETGVCPPPDPPVPRGEQFGAAVYPRASIANHSCCPNISHKPDKSARMIFTANRDISAGDECCITYFDMTQYVALKDRREHLQGLFRFKCRCARCIADEEEEQEQERETGKALYSDEGDGDVWDAFPGFD
ncbi:SET domain-containing protein [Aspergillus undulatus]|uniref:SET domain-containing protein n=1 Tax=Aspergillus undulatus TaxID=1810928 RepID=UPI003CCCD2B8